MDGDALAPLFFILVGGIVLGVAGYYLVRFLRGSIKIDLPAGAYSPGELINGSCELKAKRAIQGRRLVCRLIGREITTTRRPGTRGRGSRTRRRAIEIYRDEVVLEEAKDYPAGHISRHDFSIPAPDPRGTSALGGGGGALSTVMGVLTNHRTRVEWDLSIRLESKGVDLAASRRISIR